MSHESLNKMEVYSFRLFNGVIIKGLALTPGKFMIDIETYFINKFALDADESKALAIASNYNLMDKFPRRTPEQWRELAKSAAAKINWNEVPDRLDENIMPFKK